MNYSISENKLDKIVVNFLNNYFKNDEIHYFHPSDEGHEDPHRAEFYIGDYNEDNFSFFWYDENYWTSDNEIADIRRLQSPILSIQHELEDSLNGMFGKNMWHSGFKIWFESKFPLKIKTIR